jgi:hypothetical protein
VANHQVDLAANEAYERWRATERDTLGRVLKGNGKPYVAPELPQGQVNLSDPDSRVMRTHEAPGVVLADAGYWHTRQIQAISERGVDVLIPPDGAMRDGKRPGWDSGIYQRMRRRLSTDRGRELYA